MPGPGRAGGQGPGVVGVAIGAPIRKAREMLALGLLFRYDPP